ncbi:hypothetical protein NST62_06530 [Ureibacillus sp. FSL K6-8385]|uniref:hypothetical protein n=1 Tax=Ureibacillus TaxID=160795 RepID=UPI0015EF1248|nr:hypothetical protein [Ureibacillus terrenus]MED3662970.1 hypothetical protein [Ureibacillus terrenus]MED3765097.1 hypothetical protein [Ureibacillus terrenus]
MQNKFQLGDKIIVRSPSFADQLGIFLAIDNNALVWVTDIGGSLTLARTDLDGVTIAKA